MSLDKEDSQAFEDWYEPTKIYRVKAKYLSPLEKALKAEYKKAFEAGTRQAYAVMSAWYNERNGALSEVRTKSEVGEKSLKGPHFYCGKNRKPPCKVFLSTTEGKNCDVCGHVKRCHR